MNVLFATSEARPYIASGGLADVSGALPKALCAAGADCRVILPLYSDIPQNLREEMTFLESFTVRLSWRELYCGLFTAKKDGVVYYFVDNEYYFRRSGIYGHYDDGERFAFFSMAVLESIRHMNDFVPDVLHCNDWQTGLVPVFLEVFYHGDPKFSRIKTVFTIHNIQYQGDFDMFVAGDIAGLPEDKRSLVELGGRCNYMKGGIDRCDVVTTVSPTYAKEILDPWYAWGLDGFLRERSYKLTGILNGIDCESYDPEADPDIAAHFSADDLSGKAADKAALQKEVGLCVDPSAMFIGMVGRLVSHKGIDLVEYVGDRIMNMNAQMVILGSGEPQYEEFFRRLGARYPGRVSVITGFVPPLARRIYAGADVLLMPSKSEPCGLAQMIALRYGTVPIVRETGGLKDSIHDLGAPGGNGFTFKTYNADDMFNAIERAYFRYRGGEWQSAVRSAMRYDFSWHRSAAAYLGLYKAITR